MRWRADKALAVRARAGAIEFTVIAHLHRLATEATNRRRDANAQQFPGR